MLLLSLLSHISLLDEGPYSVDELLYTILLFVLFVQDAQFPSVLQVAVSGQRLGIKNNTFKTISQQMPVLLMK